MDIDVSAGLKMKLKDCLDKAAALGAAGQNELAAAEYRRCAWIMKELVKSAASPEAQKARVEKAKQYLDLARQIESRLARGGASAESRRGSGEAPRGAADSETETGEDPLAAQVAGLIVKSTVGWDEIGGLETTKREIQAAYALAMATPPAGIKIKSNRNILLYGPPGTGKTLLAAAASGGLDATFFNVKVSSVLSKYFGESSRLLSALFVEARRRAPAVVFFDEIEALVASRSGTMDGPERRILSTFLTELDGLTGKQAPEFLLTIGATNIPWDLDEAILSRFGKLIYVPLPDEETRRQIFGLQLGRAGYQCETAPDELVRRSAGYSGRDIERLCTEAIERMLAEANRALVDAAGKDAATLRGQRLTVRPIGVREFDEAFDKIQPKTSRETLRRYEAWAKRAVS